MLVTTTTLMQNHISNSLSPIANPQTCIEMSGGQYPDVTFASALFVKQLKSSNNKMKIHPSITLDQIMSAVDEDDNIGFCIFCGAEHDGVEPDARNNKCEQCGNTEVFGAAEILIQVV